MRLPSSYVLLSLYKTLLPECSKLFEEIADGMANHNGEAYDTGFVFESMAINSECGISSSLDGSENTAIVLVQYCLNASFFEDVVADRLKLILSDPLFTSINGYVKENRSRNTPNTLRYIKERVLKSRFVTVISSRLEEILAKEDTSHDDYGFTNFMVDRCLFLDITTVRQIERMSSEPGLKSCIAIRSKMNIPHLPSYYAFEAPELSTELSPRYGDVETDSGTSFSNQTIIIDPIRGEYELRKEKGLEHGAFCYGEKKEHGLENLLNWVVAAHTLRENLFKVVIQEEKSEEDIKSDILRLVDDFFVNTSRWTSISDFLFVTGFLNLGKRRHNIHQYGDIVMLLKMSIVTKMFQWCYKNKKEIVSYSPNFTYNKNKQILEVKVTYNITDKKKRNFGFMNVVLLFNNISRPAMTNVPNGSIKDYLFGKRPEDHATAEQVVG